MHITKVAHRRARIIVAKIRSIEHRLLARCAICGHLTYYTLVGVEAHGNYRYAAIAVGVLLVLEAIQAHTGDAEAAEEVEKEVDE